MFIDFREILGPNSGHIDPARSRYNHRIRIRPKYPDLDPTPLIRSVADPGGVDPDPVPIFFLNGFDNGYRVEPSEKS